MNRKLLITTIAILMVSAIAFLSIGYAYSSSTVNDENNATSEYVVLSQTNYNFSSVNGLKFDNVTSELGTYYQLRNAVKIEPTIDGAQYYGVVISTDTLMATVSGTWDGKVKVSTPEMDGSWFADYSGHALDWRYVIKIEGNDTTQYAYYDGEAPEDGGLVTWKVLKKVDSKWTTGSELDIVKDVQYTTTLYFAGVGTKINDGSYAKTIGSTIHLTNSATITPIWTVANENDIKHTLRNYANPAAAEAAGKSYEERHLFFDKDSTIVLPPNLFISEGDSPLDVNTVFAGWWNEDRQKTYYVRYMFTADKDYEFTAKWANKTECTKFTFDVNMPTGYSIQSNDVTEVEPEYLLKGGYYALPANKFELTGYRFVGWTIDDGTTMYEPGYASNIPYDADNVTIKAHWAPWTDDSPNKKITFDGTIGYRPYKLIVYTDDNGDYVLPENIMGPYFSISQYEYEWKFDGWCIHEKSTYERTGKYVAQSYTMPIGTDNMLINNGTIKYIYTRDPGGS